MSESTDTSNLAQQRATVQVAEAVLERRFGRHVRLDDGTPPRSGSQHTNALRCAVLDGPRNMPASVIVKRVNEGAGWTYNPDAEQGPAILLFNEWAGLQFLDELALDVPLAPHFYGGDRTAGLVVMEDLGQAQSLTEPLTGDDRAAAMAALEAFFRSLGRLNAATCGHHEQYWRISDGLGPRGPMTQLTLDAVRQGLANILNGMCDRIGLTSVAGLDEDLARIAAYDVTPGPFLGYSQGDTCPDNCIRYGDWMRFFDFEWGAFRNVLNEVARARSVFPTCWCASRLPDAVIRQCEAVYRSELVKGCPAAANDTIFNRRLVAACALTLTLILPDGIELWDSDQKWGLATLRQRAIARFEMLAQTTAEFDYLEALGAVAKGLADGMKALWPGMEPMPLYPPFRT